MKTTPRLLAALLGLTLAAAAHDDGPSPSPVLEAMQQELDRSMRALREQPLPPYFLSYEITENHRISVSGSFGTLGGSNESRSRLLDVDLRVGDYSLDNTHQIRGNRFESFNRRFSFVPIPVDDDPDAIRSALWFHTDSKYKQAMERLTRVKTNVQVKVEQEDKSDDFSRESAEKHLEAAAPVTLDRALWEEKVRKYTAPFSAHSDIYQAQAQVTGQGQRRWFVSSEGARIQTARPSYRLSVFAVAKAEDGMELPRFESFFASTVDGLPSDEEVLAVVDKMIEDLDALRVAPVIDPYTGPAILSGRAAGVFFHEIFGHRIEGHRQKSEDEGQTFKKKVGEQVLPVAFNVYFDPTLATYRGTDLAGFYRYDNQGVKSRRVPVIESGVFKSFLMSRSPVEGFAKSNGHGRKQAGFQAVARQSNLLVEVADAVTPAGLKTRLIELVDQEGKPFGLRFEDIQGGFTMTGRTIPNAFNVLPIMVYRVFPDGTEELVRGVDLIGTPLTAFSKVVAADNHVGVFNGTCGAESGGVPVAAASPGLLVSQIEVQKKDKSQERAPILPAPFDDQTD